MMTKTPRTKVDRVTPGIRGYHETPVISEATMTVLGKTEAASAGCNRAEAYPDGLIDASKIPAPKAEYSLTQSALCPFQAEPTQSSATPVFCGKNHKA